MTTADISPAAAAPVASYNKNLKKPDDAAHKKFLEDLNKTIDSLKKQNVRCHHHHHHHYFFFLLTRISSLQETVKSKIEKLGKSDPARREDLKNQLNEIRDKQSDIKKSKKSVYEQLDALNDSIKKKVKDKLMIVNQIHID